MMNGDFVSEEVEHFASRIEKTGGDSAKQIDSAFEIALGRLPSESERSRLITLIPSSGSVREGLMSLCRVLFNANEFIYVD
jgi:hypothetical protein